MPTLPDFITQYVCLADEDMNAVTSRFSARHIHKGRFYLQPGQVNGEFAFVERGTLRVSHLTADGRELTGWLAVEGQSFCDLTSFRDQRPTRFAVQALSDADLWVITYADMQVLYQTIPGWQEFGRRLWEDVSANLINAIVSFQAESAQMRYERLSDSVPLLRADHATGRTYPD